MIQLRSLPLPHDRARSLGVRALRQFSAISTRAAEGEPGPPRGPNKPNSGLRRPPGAVDARSLGAPQGGARPPNVLKLRTPRTGGAPGTFRPRVPMRPRAKNKPDGKRRPRRRRNDNQPEEEPGDAARMEEVNKVYRDLTKEQMPKPMRYDPQQADHSTMKETWPSLPTDATASVAGVSEKLSYLTKRYANGYIPPYELGKRLYEGKSVRFYSEEEKNEAIEEARRLAQQHADELTQRKGDLVEPEPIEFQPISSEDRNTLIRTLVQGHYSDTTPPSAEESPHLHHVQVNLNNNATYRTPGKASQLMAKVDSLLSSGRRQAAR